jgi:Histidine kinase-, DNA gyrase B-, and HSP90-like ATPase
VPSVGCRQEVTADLLRGLSSSARKLDRLLTNLLGLEQLGWGMIPLNASLSTLPPCWSRWRHAGAKRPPLATSLRIFDDGMAGSRQGGTYRRGAAGQHRTAHPQDTPVWIRADRQGTGLRLAVEDAGPGVPSEMRTSVFERFRHGETAPTYAPGLGIGLSLVLRLAQLHGGTAWVEDRPGGGSSFQVTLPGPPH